VLVGAVLEVSDTAKRSYFSQNACVRASVCVCVKCRVPTTGVFDKHVNNCALCKSQVRICHTVPTTGLYEQHSYWCRLHTCQLDVITFIANGTACTDAGQLAAVRERRLVST
jgi:hypothetical protein